MQLSPWILDLGKITLYRTGGKADFDEFLAHIWPAHHENVGGELVRLDADGYRPLRPTVVPLLD